jgi:hypothetical protein
MPITEAAQELKENTQITNNKRNTHRKGIVRKLIKAASTML